MNRSHLRPRILLAGAVCRQHGAALTGRDSVTGFRRFGQTGRASADRTRDRRTFYCAAAVGSPDVGTVRVGTVGTVGIVGIGTVGVSTANLGHAIGGRRTGFGRTGSAAVPAGQATASRSPACRIRNSRVSG